MKIDTRVLSDALACASVDVIRPRKTNDKVGHRKTPKLEMVRHGRGVITGVVSGLMAAGVHFDDAWRLCLETRTDIYLECIPPQWPKLEDYRRADDDKQQAEMSEAERSATEEYAGILRYNGNEAAKQKWLIEVTEAVQGRYYLYVQNPPDQPDSKLHGLHEGSAVRFVVVGLPWVRILQ